MKLLVNTMLRTDSIANHVKQNNVYHVMKYHITKDLHVKHLNNSNQSLNVDFVSCLNV